jgi:hypothetical protein
MINNKKGEMLKSFGIIATMSLVIISAVFVFYFFYISGNNFISVPLTDAGLASGFDPLVTDAMVDAGETYQNTNLKFIDYGILLSLTLVVVVGLAISYFSRSLNYFSFLGMLTYGLMFLLFIVGVVEQYTGWIYDMMINLFPTMVIDLPVFDYFLSNMGIFILILTGFMLLINQIDFDLAVITKRKDKERDILDQNEIN